MTLKINITSELLTKLNIISSEYHIELGGYLTGEIRDGCIYLKDILIPNQTISGVSVQLTPKDQIDLLKKYGPDKCKQIIGHYHSHHTMGCFWSGTDRDNMRNIMTYKDFFVFIVGSRGNNLIKVCQTKPFPYEYNKIILNVKTVGIELMRKRVKEILDENLLYGIPYASNEEQADIENILNNHYLRIFDAGNLKIEKIV